MSEIKIPEFLTVESALKDSGLAVTPSELHGLLTGMISGGLSLDDQTWKPLIYDYTNDGMGWPDSAIQVGTHTFQSTVEELMVSPDKSLTPEQRSPEKRMFDTSPSHKKTFFALSTQD